MPSHAFSHDKESAITIVDDDTRANEEEDDPPLIELDDEPKSRRSTSGGGANLQEQLRVLLKTMERAVEDAAPSPVAVAPRRILSPPERTSTPALLPRRPASTSNSVAGPSRLSISPPARSSSPREEQTGWKGRRSRIIQQRSLSGEEDEEEDSPPTPPPRIVNPYLNPNRRVSGENSRRSVTPPSGSNGSGRMTSRAAVLNASMPYDLDTSTSADALGVSQPSPPSERQPSALQRFIQSHPQPTTQDTSSSRHDLNLSTSSSGSSRKGKERAHTPEPVTHPHRRDSTASSDLSGPRRSHTPRKFSVDIAEDSVMFAEGAEAQLHAQVDLDLDVEEAEGEPPWASETESVADSANDEPEAPEHTLRAVSSSLAASRRILQRPRRENVSSATPQQQDLRRSPIASRSLERRQSDDISLPALPEPDVSTSPEQEEVDTLSSRQAALFRSTSTSLSRSAIRQPSSSPGAKSPPQRPTPHTSPSNHSPSRFIRPDASFHLSPVKVGMALHTPQKTHDTSVGPTPRPPGAWRDTPVFARTEQSVRFSSPLASEQTHQDQSEDISVHRLKLSPARSPKRSPKSKSPSKSRDDLEGDADTSFTARLTRSVTKNVARVLPRPSKTLQEAQVALGQAAKESAAAGERVELSQRMLLEALSQMSLQDGVAVVKTGWGWGTWVWWMSMEVLLLWGVFRWVLCRRLSGKC